MVPVSKNFVLVSAVAASIAMVDDVSALHANVSSGLFGADMQVSLINDGPITISLASKK